MPDLNAALNALPGFPQLRGARIRLRAPRADDESRLFALFSDAEAMRHWSSAPMRDLAQAAGKIEEFGEAFVQRSMIGWIIADARDAAIGTCSLFHFDAAFRRCDTGYALRSDAWRKGLAQEALTLALNWAFRALPLAAVRADTAPGNLASKRLLERLGFRSDASPQSGIVRAETTGFETFVLTADEWCARR